MTGLLVENLSVELGGTQILHNVDLTLRPGEVVGLIGANGAGKSTALKAALGLIARHSGSVRLAGEDTALMPPKERAKKMAYVPQGAPVHWPLTVERTVALGRVPHLNPWQDMSPADDDVIQCALQKTDCWHLRDRLVTTLSGGERSRVLLARTLAVGAGFMLADEPTASLDPMHQLQVMDILRAEAASGTGILVVLHDLGQALRYCDRLILLQDGSVAAEGAPDAVLTDANLEAAFGVKVARWQADGASYLVPKEVVK